mgnify:CR=1 FL=1
MNLFIRILESLEARLNQPRISLWRTLYFNFRTLPFGTAIKLPVFIYTKVHLFGLNGNVKFENTPIRRGMVRIGINADSFALRDGSGFIQLSSRDATIVFEGPASISVNSKVRAVAGELRFGKYTYIGEGVRIICNGSTIQIGEYTRIAFESVIMNSGFHHVYNSNKQSITRTTRPIHIGRYSWIGNRSAVSAGAAIKEYTIVCAGSLVNRDFNLIEGDNQMLGGSPAKVICCGMHRIFSPKLESQVIKWFKEHPTENIYAIKQFYDNTTDINSEFER